MPFPVEDKYIEEAEAKLGLQPPPSFRNRLRRMNGGEVEAADDSWILHPVFDKSDTKRLKRTCNDIVRETHLARQWRGFPENGVAIADNGTRELLILLSNPNAASHLDDRIHFWSHETGEIEKIADDFSKLE